MKKMIVLVLCLAMALSVAGCGENKEEVPEVSQGTAKVDLSKPENWNINTHELAEPYLKQAAVNECCKHSNCEKLLGFEIGSKNYLGWYPETADENPQVIYEIYGSYYPTDRYGDMGDREYFEMTVLIDVMTGAATMEEVDISKYKY